MPKAEGKKAASCSRNYQDNVITPLSCEYDCDATADNEIDKKTVELDDMLPAIEGLQKIIKAVCSSPQHHQTWTHEIEFMQVDGDVLSHDPSTSQRSLVLILNVRTWWASTHQMLYKSQPPFNQFPAHRCQGAHSTTMTPLTPLYWETRTFMPSNLVILTGIPSNLWLHGWSPFDLQPQRCQPPRYRCFQQCTRFFEDYKTTSRTFFANFPAWCHQRSNLASQMHIASSATTTTNLMHLPSIHGPHVHVFLPDLFISNFLLLSVLDPQISYEGMKVDYANDPILSDHLEESKSDLFDRLASEVLYGSISQEREDLCQQTWRILQTPYGRLQSMQSNPLVDRLTSSVPKLILHSSWHLEYSWWVVTCQSHTTGWINIYSGSAVTVERIFSGGCDTISLWCTSLHADTIRTLMLVKRRLHLAHAQANAIPRSWPSTFEHDPFAALYHFSFCLFIVVLSLIKYFNMSFITYTP